MITCNYRVHVRDWIACKFIEQIILFEISYLPSKLFRLWIHTQRSHRVSNLDAAPREALCDGLSCYCSIAFCGQSLEAQTLPLIPSQQLQLHSPPFPLSHRRSAATVPCKSSMIANIANSTCANNVLCNMLYQNGTCQIPSFSFPIKSGSLLRSLHRQSVFSFKLLPVAIKYLKESNRFD